MSINFSEEDTMSRKEVAEYLGVSEATAYRRLKKAGIKPIKYNPELERQQDPRYLKSDVQKIRRVLCRAA